MSNYSKFIKRAQIWVLTLAMILPLLTPMFALTVFAKDGESETVSVGKVVVNNYADLTEAEKDLIGSGVLVGGNINYQKPTADDNLISVDSDTKTVVVKSHKDSHGNVWNAISAKIMVGETVKETVKLTDGKGTYSYNGNAFSVDVEYALDKAIDTDLQNLLLTAPESLYNALDALQQLSSITGKTFVIEKAMPTMYLLATTGYQIELFGQKPYLTWSSDAANDSTKKLDAQMKANGDKLDLTVLVEEYKAADNKVEFLVNKGAALKAAVDETLTHLQNIISAPLWNTVISYAPDGEDKDTFKLLQTNINEAIALLSTVSAMDWSATEEKLVKDGATEAEYVTLETLVAFTNGVFTEVTAKEEVRVASTTIRYNMSMFDVTVKLVLNVVENNKVVEYAVKPQTVITLAEGTTAADILAAVDASGIVNKALTTDWAGVYVDGKFNVEKSLLTETLVSDLTYTITYSPKNFTVKTDYNGTHVVPYGFVEILPAHSDILKAYDYTVNGTVYAQGSQIKVVEDVNITRKEGKAYTASNFYKIVADNYLSGKGAAILNSGALTNNVAVNVRYPDNKNKLVVLKNGKLTAGNYESSYEGLVWVPYSYKLSTGTVGYFAGKNEVEITAPSYDSVTVTYRLTLSNFDKDTVLNAANLADVLYNESKGQLSVLNALAGQSGNLELLNSTMIDILKGYVKSTKLNANDAKDALLKAKYEKVLNDIAANCLNKTGNLELYEIIAKYNQASDKLYFYYQNSASIINEVNKFSGYMTELLGAEPGLTAAEKLGALESIMNAVPDQMVDPADIPRYLERFTTLETEMASYMKNLSAPNAAIDLTSNKLAALTAALQSEGTTQKITSVGDLYLEDSSIVIVSDGKVAFKVTLTIEGGQTVIITSGTINKDNKVDSAIVNDILNKINAAVKDLNSDYYTTDYNEKAIKALIGQVAGDIDETDFEFSWSYKSFKVSVPGMEDQTVNFSDRIINFTQSTNPEYRYDYYINGVLYNGEAYSLTDEDLSKLANGKFKVTLEKVYVLREDLINYVEKLNQAAGAGAASFVLVEAADGSYSIVLKINAAEPNALAGAVMGIAQGVITGHYPYVGIDGNGFLQDSKVHLQTLVDMFMNSGFGSEALIKAINSNGSINNMKLSGSVIAGANNSLGGKLVESTMQLGFASDDVIDLDFYVTLGGVSAEIVEVRNALAGELRSLFSFECNGSFGASFNMPQKVYEAMLAVLLVTEQITINNINDVNGEVSAMFVDNMIQPLLAGDITVKTFENTLKKLGVDVNISSIKGVQTAYQGIVNFYKNAEFVYDETSATASGIVAIEKLINGLNLGELGNIIAEKETGIKVAFKVALDNLDNDYEALFIDINANGITNKIGLTNDVCAKLDKIEGTAFVLLLSDVEGDLVVDTTTILNLNGFTVKGNLICNGKTVVIDSYMGDDHVGTVTGKVSGDAIIVAGKYAQDVTKYIKSGYVQNANGVVENEYFKVVETEDNIDITLNADVLDLRSMPNIPSIALDIACDLLFNGYSSNYLAIDGNMIYNISVHDLIGIYTSTNRKDALLGEVLAMIDSEALSNLLNTILDDVFDFTAISEAIANGKPVVEYNVLTKPWAAEFEHVDEGDYITASLANGKTSLDKELRVFVEGNDKNINYLVDLFAEFGKTITADINVYVKHGKNGNDIYLTASADANVFVDWTNTDYAVMFSVILADGLGSSKNAGLIKGINEYYATGEINKLATEFNRLTVNDLIKALEKFDRDDSFEAMVTRLALDSVVKDEVLELESLYDKIGKVIAYGLRTLDIDRGSRSLGSYMDADAVYGISRDGLKKFIARTFFGYDFSVDVQVKEASFGIKLFGKGDVIPEEKIDYTKLLEQIAIAAGLNEADYTADSWAAMKKVYAEAVALVDNAISQEQVDVKADQLKAAIAALVLKPVIDYSKLLEQIAIAGDLNEADYTEDSWAAMKKVYAEAVALVDNAETQEQVDAKTEELKAAIAALVLKPGVVVIDYSKLLEQIAIADSLKEDGYTPESWAAMKKVYDEAVALIDNAETQKEVDDKTEELKAAIAALVPVEIDTGDNAPLFILIAIAIVSAFGAAVVIKKRKVSVK